MIVDEPVYVKTLTSDEYEKLKLKNARTTFSQFGEIFSFEDPGSIISFDKVYHNLSKTFSKDYDKISQIKLYSNKKIVNANVKYIWNDGYEKQVESDIYGGYPPLQQHIDSSKIYATISVQVQLESSGFLQVVYKGILD